MLQGGGLGMRESSLCSVEVEMREKGVFVSV